MARHSIADWLVHTRRFLIARALRGAVPAVPDFNLTVVDVLDDLGKIAHVEPSRAGRALHEVIGLVFGDGICVGPGLRH
jgi:hypothetical protein